MAKKKTAKKSTKRKPPKGFRTWKGYMASIRPGAKKAKKKKAAKKSAKKVTKRKTKKAAPKKKHAKKRASGFRSLFSGIPGLSGL